MPSLIVKKHYTKSYKEVSEHLNMAILTQAAFLFLGISLLAVLN